MLNLPFTDVENMPIFRALKREAEIHGQLDRSDPRYTKLQDLCNYFRENCWLTNMNGAANAWGDVHLMFPRADTWQQIRERLREALVSVS